MLGTLVGELLNLLIQYTNVSSKHLCRDVIRYERPLYFRPTHKDQLSTRIYLSWLCSFAGESVYYNIHWFGVNPKCQNKIKKQFFKLRNGWFYNQKNINTLLNAIGMKTYIEVVVLGIYFFCLTQCLQFRICCLDKRCCSKSNSWALWNDLLAVGIVNHHLLYTQRWT